MTSRFNPSVDEVRKRREDTGNGLVDCKRELLRRNMVGALENLAFGPLDYKEAVLRDVLLVALKEGLI